MKRNKRNGLIELDNPLSMSKTLVIAERPVLKLDQLNEELPEYLTPETFLNLETTWLEMPTNHFERIICENLIQKLDDPRKQMAELWRIAAHNGTLVLSTPYGGSDDHWDDPENRRPWTLNTPMRYARPVRQTDEGYGDVDWQPMVTTFRASKGLIEQIPEETRFEVLHTRRNACHSIQYELRANKPMRPLNSPDKVRMARILIEGI